ncbi:MAG: hypothetical protein OEW18_04155, partial [Candidatus Aminicenantes bacterium]|nr:hypothetical protein [Candidatus Aminicenantes bacterium]
VSISRAVCEMFQLLASSLARMNSFSARSRKSRSVLAPAAAGRATSLPSLNASRVRQQQVIFGRPKDVSFAPAADPERIVLDAVVHFIFPPDQFIYS